MMTVKKSINRLISLDVFRGIVIAVMIIVNSPGNKTAYSWLEHSVWNGCTLADLVFPFFIVIGGISTTIALTNSRIKGLANQDLLKVIFKRSIFLFGMGVLLNYLPNHFDLNTLRVLGVLQRIAICYFFSSILFLTTTIKKQFWIIVTLLCGYWFLLSNYPSTSPFSLEHNLVGAVDRMLILPQHLYTPIFDPEGLLSTIPAIASALMGNMIATVIISSRTQQYKLAWMLGAGLALVLSGLIWSIIFPINKSLWTSSYVLWTTGVCYLMYAICFALIEVKKWESWTKPLILLGKNSLLAYFLHVLFLKIQAIILIHSSDTTRVNTRYYITNQLFSFLPPKMASLSYAITYTLLWIIVIKCIIEIKKTKSYNFFTTGELN